MSEWETVELGQIFTLKYGKALKTADRNGGSIPVIGSSGIVGWHDSSIVDKPTLVVGRKGSIGSLTLTKGESWPIDTAYYVDINLEKVDLKWLTYRLSGFNLKALNRAAAVPGLNRDDVYRLRTALPPLEQQRHITSILDEADAIRTNRREQLGCLDELVRALFFENFGNPLLNSRFKRLSIDKLAKVVTGNTPSRSQSSNYGEGIDWVKSDNLGAQYITNADEQLTEIGKRKSRVAPTGSVLVCCIAGSRRSIGRASIANKEVAFNQQINAILPSAALDPIFLYSQLLVAPELVRRKSTGGMKGLVSKSAFASIEILVPPKHAQEAFSSKVAEIRAERDRVERALEADEELFAALQHRAFRGEL